MPENSPYLIGRFQYLVDKPRESGKEQTSVIKHFGGRAAIIMRRLIIIWSSQSQHFYVFESISKLKKFLEEVPVRNQHYFEVIFAEQKQKPKFDIDGGTPAKAEEVRKEIRRQLGPNIGIIVCDSSSGSKFSRHIIVNKYYKNAAYAKELVDDVAANIEDSHIDEDVYKDIQQFRIVGSSKIGGLPKKIITPGYKFEDTLIGSYRVR